MTAPVPHRRRRDSGFTLVEMLIVVALVGIVATLALPSYRWATQRAREAVLRENLWTLRNVIDQFYTDRGRYPASLEEMVGAGYLRKVPLDPITEQPDWVTSFESLATDVYDDSRLEEPGITDVRSNAAGYGLDGSPYSEW